MDLASSPGSLPKNSDEVDSSWINSCFLDNGDVPSSGAHDWGALKNALDEIEHVDVSEDKDERRSDDEHEIYEVLLKAKGIMGLDDLQNDYVYSALDPGEGIDSAVPISAAGGMESEESIFKVWDLNTELEEGDFERELKTALADSKPAFPSVPFDIEAAKKDDPNFVVNEEDKQLDLNLLVADMADLSLSNQDPEE
ncbi:uncharacterized protein LOC116260241 [Nymphaea colorata]|uniref:uncharacterized protein LOC116260241 n=1 Tax=Nymphaea colorata TaxID=210225 RepID=UPI00129D4DD2|nr:uncharacterized protein LOC116260241 [Nymphaea colorata]